LVLIQFLLPLKILILSSNFAEVIIMDNENKSSFMDTRTLIAVTLVAVLFIGWQNYLKRKYGTGDKPAAVAEGTAKPGETAPSSPSPATPSEGAKAAAATTPSPKAQIEQLLNYENSNISFQISSQGMGLKNLVLKNHSDRNHQPMKMGASEQNTLFELGQLGNTDRLFFNITKKSDNEFEGVAQNGGARIVRTLKIDPETNALENTVHVENIDKSFPGLTVTIPEQAIAGTSGSLLNPSFEHQEFVVIHSGTEDRINSSAATEKIDKTFPAVSVAGIGTQYFTSAVADRSEVIPEARVVGGHDSKEISTQLIYKNSGDRAAMDLNWVGYTGGKSVSTLEKIDKDLSRVVDLGFFASIGRILLKLLQWFHSVFGNWGVSIILLTLLVRILVLPLNVSTFRSTKKMQKLQPHIAAVRERFKDDPQAMNREMMGLWKEHKVNPVGGCLPMLLQLPIFFALYRVLGQSIELYQAPFFGWIHDLSLKDPYYVLPALMAICMFIQQKITPTTMDPTQAKVMQFLPLIFAVMMVSLPSGLTLYIFINTLAGILLQQLFMRDRSKAVTIKEAKA
jgi:YidC/Oxa1 family membrane protein insertase